MLNLLINFVGEERSLYTQIACNKNQLIMSIIAKKMFCFQFDQLNWAYYVQEPLNPEVKVLPHFSPLSFSTYM